MLWVKAGLVNSNKKSRVLTSNMRVLPKGCTKGRPWKTGQTWSQGLLGKFVLGTYVFLWLCSYYLGHELDEGVGVSLRFPQATWPNEMAGKAAVPWSSLSKLLTRFSSLRTESGIHPIGSPALGPSNFSTSFAKSPAHKWQMWDFSTSIIIYTNTL